MLVLCRNARLMLPICLVILLKKLMACTIFCGGEFLRQRGFEWMD